MRQTVKQWIIIGLVAVVFFLVLGRLGFYETHYTMTGEVIKATAEEVIVATDDGNVWAFDGEDFAEQDLVELTMFTNGTDLNKYDDEITAVKKIS